MALERLGQWYCDQCGGVIQSAAQGVLEWKLTVRDDGKGYKKHEFKVVHVQVFSHKNHYNGCYHYIVEDHGDIGLRYFTGDLGMINMLAMIERERAHDEDYSGPEVDDLREWVELMRRFFIPYYESA